MDTITPEARSALMARIRSKNTKAEIIVRSCIHRLGYRFRLHDRNLPGSPDIVLPRLKTVVFVHGCFWHRHKNCRFAYTPKTRSDFWLEKLEGNAARDKRTVLHLRRLGWNVAVIWECETRNPDLLLTMLVRLMNRLDAGTCVAGSSKQGIRRSGKMD